MRLNKASEPGSMRLTIGTRLATYVPQDELSHVTWHEGLRFQESSAADGGLMK
jgi:hypothetical protein